MPATNHLLTSFLLALQLATNGKALTTEIRQAIPENDLQRNCNIELGGYGFNLCPLVGRSKLIKAPDDVFEADDKRGEQSSGQQNPYVQDAWMTLGGSELNKARKGSLCDEDTWVCLSDTRPTLTDVSDGMDGRTRIHRSSTKTAPIVRKESKSQLLASIQLDDNLDAEHAPFLKLMLRNPETDTTFDLIIFCEDRTNELIVGSFNGRSRSFQWGTPQGCPTKRPTSTTESIRLLQELSDESPAEEQPTDEPPAQEEQQGDDELLPTERHHLRSWIAFVVVFVLASFAVISTILTSPRARHYIAEHIYGAGYAILPSISIAALKLKPIADALAALVPKGMVPFRQGDSSLVRWAEEEMALDSEDVMVNGRGAYEQYDVDVEGWNGDGMDEYIPLTLSSKYGKGRRVRSYGATPEVETFAESQRAAGSGMGFSKFFKK
ncbi:hypothetical protein CPB83DRAFT_856907 [Crepidotus variabilis]|uniref:Autophagy-related protein 27 n=1 Tax=Crepidotus variabilis TaxID=179855 RepID=A0A9P6EDU4_9AGAR|nr:hypothetical protein CPB83DRAFT_856907 [Crepidotus variabilis]